ncbi:MAG: hypothetical protein WCP28_13215 [Actinomycetes bacterium]
MSAELTGKTLGVTPPRVRRGLGGLAVAVVLTALLSACGSSNANFSSDPKAYTSAAASTGMAVLPPNTAGAEAAAALGERYRQGDVGASNLESGGWGPAGSPTDAAVTYVVMTGGADVRKNAEAVAFAGMGKSQPQNYSVNDRTQTIEGAQVRIVTQRGPDFQTVTAEAMPNSDVTIIVTSSVGNEGAVVAAVTALLKAGNGTASASASAKPTTG